MKQDRFLIVILAVIALLAITALALFFTRQRAQVYLPDDTPAGVVHNYILALHEGDYERAYSYLKEAAYKPSSDRFRRAYIMRELDISNAAVQIGETDRTDHEAVVRLVIIHSGFRPFENTWQETLNAMLVQDESGVWKISSLPYPYWGWDWYTPPVTPIPAPLKP